MPPIGQPGVTVTVASAILDQLTRFPVIDAETCSPRFGSIRSSRLLGETGLEIAIIARIGNDQIAASRFFLTETENPSPKSRLRETTNQA